MSGVRDPRLPVLILSGFLGSGKTTLLRAALQRSDLRRTLVIVNEVADQGVDDRLLATSGEPVRLLGNGCLCCSADDGLGRSLLRIAEDEALLRSVDRIVIETSGLADPAPAFAALARAGRVSARMRLHAIVTLVDAMHAGAQAGESPEFALQLQAADQVLVSKLGLPGAAPLAAVRELVEGINPVAPVAAADAATLAALVHREGSSRADRIAADWLPAGPAQANAGHRIRLPGTPSRRHDGDVRSFCLEFDQGVDWNALSVWLSLMLHVHGNRLLRIKGFVAVEQGSAPVVIHCVRHVVHFPEHLADWPDERRTSYLVFIVRDLEPEQVLRSFLAFTGRPGARMAGGPAPAPHHHPTEAATA
ncbi:GTP-binding protein [Ramlibacter sp.]|uniref:CobW family GTP-binding protein n=1 Tax=Ramlibacter sp. TaxID=1917967 RepID=UPI002D50AC1E|nr:GTP-binding protein [Ramlibacter sp.]HYD75812.1 GTP-binding protein [Ramlibacter sp.]